MTITFNPGPSQLSEATVNDLRRLLDVLRED